MKLQPLIAWWFITPLALAGIGFIGWQIWQEKLWQHKKKRLLLIRWIRRAVLILLLLLTALGPSIPGGVSSPGIANLDVFFVVDTTTSMGAQDYAGTQQRLVGVKQDLTALSSQLKGAHVELITFDSKANVVLPLSTDEAAITTAIQNMTLEIFGTSKGSAIDEPLAVTTQQLKDSKTAHPDRQRLLFYLSDGEQTAQSAVKSFSPAASYLSGGAVLGYGTTQGAQMLKNTGLSGTAANEYVTTPDPNTKALVPAVSKIDERALKKIADELKVTYANRNNGGSLGDVAQASRIQLSIDHSQKIVHYQNLYWLFAIPFAGLLFWEWRTIVLLYIDIRRQERSKHA